jgi:hypothetical protein
LRTRDWLLGASPFQAICTKFGLLKMNSIVFVLETRSHMPRLCDGMDIGVPLRKIMVVHGAKCRKRDSKAAMPAMHADLLRKCIFLRCEIAARLR